MSTMIEKRYERRLTPEEIDRRLMEGMKKDFREFIDIWWPLMQEQRRRLIEDDQEELAE